MDRARNDPDAQSGVIAYAASTGAGERHLQGSNTMTTRSRGPAAGFGWLTRGIQVSFRHPKPLLGGAAILVLVCLLPSFITMPIQFHALRGGTTPSTAIMGGTMALAMVLGLLLLPVYAGYLQVIDAAERGLPARVRDIFGPYQRGQAPGLIGFGVALLLVYAVVMVIIVMAAGGGVAGWYAQVFMGQASHLPPATGLPAGFGTALALALVFGLFLMGFYAISLGQVAFRRRGVFGAIGDGLVGAVKNLLPLIVFAVSLVLAWLVVGIALMLVGILLALIGKMVSAWLALVLIVPLYFALVLVMFAVMFGTMYYLWRDVCGDDAAPAAVPTMA